jgi:2-phospho-L-lactate guanylyltransferase
VGVNSAVELGMQASEAERWMVIPADIPLISADEIRRALSFDINNAEVVIAPSRAFDGTNLLLFPSRSRLPLSYDTNSFWNHLERASAGGMSVAVYTGMGVVLDIDTIDDLRELARQEIDIPSANFAREVLQLGHHHREL